MPPPRRPTGKHSCQRRKTEFTERTIHNSRGKLQAFKLGGTWRFRRGDLDKWTASRIGRAMVDDDKGEE
jgi:hypothetical protein